MEFQPIYDTVTVGCALPVATTQTVVDARFGLTEECVVLSAQASAVVKRCEKGAELRYEGEIVATALCAGKEIVFSLKQTVPFSDTVSAKANGEVYGRAQVIGVEIVSVTEREAKVAITLSVSLFSQEKEEIVTLSGAGAGVYTKQKQATYLCCREAGEKTVELAEETENVFDTFCHAVTRAIVTKRSVGPEVLTVEGEWITDFVGIKDGELTGKTVVTPFTEEIAVEGARYGDTVTTDLVVTADNAVMTDGILSYSAEAILRYEVCFDDEFSYSADAYYVENELIVTSESHTVCGKKVCETVYDRADGTIAIDDAPLCESVLCADGFRGEIASAVAEDGSVTVQGVAVGNVVYLTAEGNTYSLAASVPFSFTFLLPCEADGEVVATACPTAVTVRARRANEIDVKVELAFQFTVCKTHSILVISRIECGQAREKQTAALSVCVGKEGDTLWEMARELGCAPDEITAQNDVVFPLAGGERVILYRGLKN